jgi:hypothetical protein
MIKISIKETGMVPGMLKREFNNLMRQCYRAMGTWWHAQMRPKHFTHRGATEYGYDPRQGERGSGAKTFKRSYSGRKLRKFGHTLPLVWTGASRTRSLIRDIRVTKDSARVVLSTPTLNFKRGRKPGAKKTLREEMTTVSDGERKELARVFDRAFEAAVRENRDERTTTM